MIIRQESAEALDKQHREELRSLTEHQALHAADLLLAMAAKASYPASKEQSDGLIERQRILYGNPK